MENMTIEEINNEINRLKKLQNELKRQEELKKKEEMRHYIGQYVKEKENPCRIAMVYDTDGDYLVCDYIEYQQQYFEIVSDDCKQYTLNEVELITSVEFKNTVMNWVSEIFKHYNIES